MTPCQPGRLDLRGKLRFAALQRSLLTHPITLPASWLRDLPEPERQLIAAVGAPRPNMPRDVTGRLSESPDSFGVGVVQPQVLGHEVLHRRRIAEPRTP